jgi:Ca2+-binding RTX toxin-like protein
VQDLDNFSFPFLDNPMELFGLLMGKDVTLVRWDMPTFKFEFSYSQNFPIFGPLNAHLGGKIGATIDIGFGYDTYGLRLFIEDWNAAHLLEGFFIADYDAAGNERPELTLYGEIFAGASINLMIVEAGVTGGVFATIEFDLNDPNDDGKVRFTELASNALLDPRCIFDIHGELGLFLEAFLKVDLFFLTIDKTWRFAEITLFEFDITCPEPVLADVDDDGILLLHVGDYADRRENVCTLDGAEVFIVSHVGGDPAGEDGETVTVAWRDYTQEFEGVRGITFFSGDQDDSFDLSGVLAPIRRIDLGDGNDTLILGEGGGMAFEEGQEWHVHGGAGDDIITAGAGAGLVIYGGDGSDTLTAGSAPIEIHGGAQADTITGSSGDDRLFGGGGADIITGNGGNDYIEGGPGNDTITTEGGNDTIFGNEGNDTIRAGPGDDWVDGGSGADVIHGGPGNDILIGGEGDDLIYGGPGDDFLIGDDGSIDISDPARPVITGIDGEGDDVLVGGGGRDALFGGRGNDLLIGGTVLLDGGTEVVEDDGNDFLDGGPGDDILIGDDAYGASHSRDTGISVAGTVWLDDPALVTPDRTDHLFDEGERGLAGVRVEIFKHIAATGPPDPDVDPLIGVTTTGPGGSFEFLGLRVESYYLRFTAPGGYLFVNRDHESNSHDTRDSDADPATGLTEVFTLTAGQRRTDLAAGFQTAAPVVVVEDAAVVEGDRGQVAMTFVVRLSYPSSRPITLDYFTAQIHFPGDVGTDAEEATASLIIGGGGGGGMFIGGVRLSTGDYEPVAGTIEFAPWETLRTVTVLVNGDTTWEDRHGEQFRLVLTNLDGDASFAYPDLAYDPSGNSAVAVGTIIEDDPVPEISISDFVPDYRSAFLGGYDSAGAHVTEDGDGLGGPGRATFIVSLSHPSDQVITVDYKTLTATLMNGAIAPDAAEAGSDYIAHPLTTLTFAPGETEKTIVVEFIPDELDEPEEQFFVELFNPNEMARIADQRGVGIIPDDDDEVLVSLAVWQGEDGPINVNETTRLEGDAGYTEVRLQVSLVRPGAPAWDDLAISDLRASGKTVTVSLADAYGTAIPEFGSDPTDARTFGDYRPLATSDNMGAAAGGGLDAATTLVFQPGDTQLTFSVWIKGDTFDEADLEHFFVNIVGAANAGIYNNHVVINIADDDGVGGGDPGGYAVAFGAPGFTVREDAGAARITLVRAPSAVAAAVVLTTRDGSARSYHTASWDPQDYQAVQQLVRFAPGETLKVVEIPIFDDAVYEGDETVLLDLRALTGAPLAAGVLTIVEDELAPRFSVANAGRVLEDDGAGTPGHVHFEVVIHLEEGVVLGTTVEFRFHTEDLPGEAVGGTDYVPNSGSGWFYHATGDEIFDGDVVNVRVDFIADLLAEPTEEFGLRVTWVETGTILDPFGVAQIGDNDPVEIRGRLFIDLDGDGYWDSNEGPLEGVEVTLVDAGGSPVVLTSAAARDYADSGFAAPALYGLVNVVVDEATVPEGYLLTTGNDNQSVQWLGGFPPITDIGYRPPRLENLPEDPRDTGNAFTNDTIFGGPGNDTIQAGGGDNLVVGGHWMTATNANAPVNSGPYDAILFTVVYPDVPGEILNHFWQVDTSGLAAYQGTVKGRVWADADGDGLQDGGETGVEGVVVLLRDAVDGDGDGILEIGNVVQAVLSAADGSFTFPGIWAGGYVLQIEAPDGTALTIQDAGPDTHDSDVNPLDFLSAPFTVAAGGTAIVDAGLVAEDHPVTPGTGFGFDAATYAVLETDPAGAAIITVTRGDATTAAAIVARAREGTAVDGVHFDEVFALLRFAIGDTARSFEVPVHDSGLAPGSVVSVLLELRLLTGFPFESEAVLFIRGGSFNMISDDDTIEAGDGYNFILGDSGTITPDGATIVDAGGLGHDTIAGGGGDDWIHGQLGDDVIDAGEGANTVFGGFGDDQVGASIHYQIIDGGPGNDTVIATFNGHFDLRRTDDPLDDPKNARLTLIDRLTGATPGVFDLIDVEVAKLTGGAAGNRFELSGWTGEAYLDGRGGSDSLVVTNDLDMILADAMLTDWEAWLFELRHGFTKTGALALSNGSTYHLGSIEHATLSGGPGANTLDVSRFAGGATLSGGGGDDLLIGGPGDDTFLFDADEVLGTDTVTGGGGTDTLDFSATTAALVVDLGRTGTAQTVVAGRLALILTGIDIENIIGGAGDDILTGNALANRLTGGPGSNILAGRAGDDIYAYATDLPHATAPGGRDVIIEDPGEGTDTIDFSATRTLPVALDLAVTGIQRVNAHLRLEVRDSAFGPGEIEILIGGDQNDTLAGNDFANTLVGGPGDDHLYGGGGDDILDGGPGNNFLDGGPGIDTLAASADTDFTLTDTSLEWNGRTDALAGIEHATLNGGGRINRFTIAGWTGTLAIDGGGGFDILSVTDDADFTLTDTTLTISSGGVYAITGIEAVRLTGGDGANLLDASAVTTDVFWQVRLDGGAGPDILRGGAGDDILIGGPGDDLLIGGPGNDSLDGGPGTDTARYERDTPFFISPPAASASGRTNSTPSSASRPQKSPAAPGPTSSSLPAGPATA